MPYLPERPRTIERAAALYLAHEDPDFPAEFRRDGVGGCWRRLDIDSGEWLRVSELAEVVAAAMSRLVRAVSSLSASPGAEPTDLQEAAYRCFSLVHAPTVTSDALGKFALDVWDLELAPTYQQAIRVAEHHRIRIRTNGGPLGSSQWRRLLIDAERPAKVRSALVMAGAEDPLRYVARSADAERTFLASALRRDPAARAKTADVYAAYLSVVPAGVRPMDRKHFRRVAEAFLGAPAHHTRDGDFYFGVVLAPASASTYDARGANGDRAGATGPRGAAR